MLGRQERTVILLLLVVAVIVITAHLVLTAAGKQPFAHPFTNATADGELVYLEGSVDQVTLTRTGGHMTMRIHNLTVFIPAQAVQGRAFQKGQNISVFGTVTTYRGEKEIVVNSAGDLRIL
jgi:DNA/RNA endonuclease YhcR with UshA esterase domain